MEGNGILRAEDLLAEARVRVEISGGRKVLVQRVSRVSIAVAIGGIPDVASLAIEKNEKQSRITPAQADQAVKAIDRILIAGVLEPKLYPDPEKGPTPSDFLEADRMTIYRAIMDHSGWTRAAGEEVAPLS